jgi:hypothetical protein
MRLFRSLLSNLSRSATHHHGKVGAKVNGNGIVNANVNVNVPVPARRFAQVHDVRIEYEDAPARTQDMASLNGMWRRRLVSLLALLCMAFNSSTYALSQC